MSKQSEDSSSPAEVQGIEDRIRRLKDRLRAGDSDLTSDELAGAIAKADEKCRNLLKAATARPLATRHGSSASCLKRPTNTGSRSNWAWKAIRRQPPRPGSSCGGYSAVRSA